MQNLIHIQIQFICYWFILLNKIFRLQLIIISDEFYVWLTVHLELYSYNEPTRCTVYLHFIELSHFYMFRPICSPLSGMWQMALALLSSRLSAGLHGKEPVRFPAGPSTDDLEAKEYHLHIYTYYLLMMGNKWARNT
jgi:hypothetical protein